MSANDLKMFLHNPIIETTLLILTSTIFILTFAFLETVLADRLAAHYCNHQAYSPLSGRSILSRDLQAHVRKIRFREEIGDRIEAYLGFLWKRRGVGKRDAKLVDLLTCGEVEGERLLGDEEVFVIGE